MEGFMKYELEMGSGALSFIKIQRFLRERECKYRQRHEDSNVISSAFFYF
jgi:hypothetical protein